MAFDFGALRNLVRELNFSANGVDATITLQPIDGPPTDIETRIIWVTPLTEDVLVGSELQRREPRRVMAVRKDEVSTLPRGSIVVAPPRAGDDDARWRVEGPERVEADHGRYVVVPDPESY